MEINVFRDKIIQAVRGLEGRWSSTAIHEEENFIDLVLSQPTLFSVYDNSCVLGKELQDFRERMVKSALGQFGFDLKDPDQTYQARQDAKGQGLLIILNEGQSIEMRLDQAAHVRRWGIEIRPQDQLQADKVHFYLTQGAIRRLESNLHQINKLCLTLTTGNLSHPEAILWKCSGLGYLMEELILDILNEHSECARRANLHEDLFEWTDLRVKYPDLKRKNGARVQVRLSNLASKQASPRHEARAYVVLSPLKIAEYLGRFADGTKEGSISKEFWNAFETPPIDERELGLALGTIFRFALEKRSIGPLGPITKVPRPIREVIQAYVHGESLDSYERTQELYKNKELGTPDHPFYTRRIRPFRQPHSTKKREASGNELPISLENEPKNQYKV